MPTLEALRDQIDRLDDELVKLLNARALCALEIGRLKKGLGLEIYQPEREADVLRRVRQAAKQGPLAPEAIARVFERIIDEARRLERQVEEPGTLPFSELVERASQPDGSGAAITKK